MVSGKIAGNEVRPYKFPHLELILLQRSDGSWCMSKEFAKLFLFMPTDKLKEEWKRLEGNWKVISGEKMGAEVGPKDLGIDRIVIVGDRMNLIAGSTGPKDRRDKSDAFVA